MPSTVVAEGKQSRPFARITAAPCDADVVACPSCATRFRKPPTPGQRARKYRCSRCKTVFPMNSGGAARPRAVPQPEPGPPRATPQRREAETEPAVAAREEARPSAETIPRRSALPRAILLGALAVLTAVTVAGAPYYLLSAGDRLRSSLHPWFKPTGYIGQSAGVLAFVMFLALWLYPLRKKLRARSGLGAMSRWLDVHIFMGLVIPLLGAIHAGWRFDGLIGFGYFSMLAVSMSGIIGKYIYLRIPRRRSGLEMTLDEIQAGRGQLILEIAKEIGNDPARVEAALDGVFVARSSRGLLGAAFALVSSDFARWRAVRALRQDWSRPVGGREALSRARINRVVRLARRELALTQQIEMLDATHRVFRFWHVAHRPIAVTALVAVLAHVGVAVALGVTWFL